jgi:hypothetical protein
VTAINLSSWPVRPANHRATDHENSCSGRRFIIHAWNRSKKGSKKRPKIVPEELASAHSCTKLLKLTATK